MAKASASRWRSWNRRATPGGCGRCRAGRWCRCRIRSRPEVLRAVARSGHAHMLGAVGAAEEGAVAFDPVADDPALAVRAGRGDRVDRAFERVEGAGAQRALDGEGLVVVVAADVAGGHGVVLGVRGFRVLRGGRGGDVFL